MTEWEAALFAVCEAPADDLPRLVLADWLDENGEPARAEFIRLQIELARSPNPLDPANARRRKRETQLLTLHERRWRAEVTAVAGGYWQGFDRGFLHMLGVHGVGRATRDLDDAFESAPLQTLSLSGEADLLAVMALRYVYRLTRLDLRNARPTAARLDAFAAADWPNHPRLLVLPETAGDDAFRGRVAGRLPWVRFVR